MYRSALPVYSALHPPARFFSLTSALSSLRDITAFVLVSVGFDSSSDGDQQLVVHSFRQRQVEGNRLSRRKQLFTTSVLLPVLCFRLCLAHQILLGCNRRSGSRSRAWTCTPRSAGLAGALGPGRVSRLTSRPGWTSGTSGPGGLVGLT